ncbi:MAG: hypothetical protein ACREU3_05465 [Steroidobacteraceae bacterium]
MSGPRNRRAFDRSRAVRAEIRALLASRSPLLPPLSAKAVRAALSLTMTERQVRRHIAAIYVAELGVCCGRVSSDIEAA